MIKNESFVILDDEDFDYKKAGFWGRAVKTCFFYDEGGLNENSEYIAFVNKSDKRDSLFGNGRREIVRSKV